MKIFVDMDNTVAETSRHEMDVSRILFPTHNLFKEEYNKEKIKLNSFKNSIALENPTILKEDVQECVNKVYGIEEFWTGIPVMEDCQQVLLNFVKKFGEESVMFVTSVFDFGGENRVYNACLTGKVKWIEMMFPFISTRNIIYTGYKWLLKGDYLIEDNPRQLDDFSGKRILFDYPYNRNADVFFHYRVNNWKEIEKIIFL